MTMVRAGSAVDDTIASLIPLIEKGDIIIDGGNSNYLDTNRRIKSLATKGIMFLGVGVSGGEEGALNGPSIMPGGTKESWQHVKPIFQKIAAKVEDGTPCCDFVGEEGSGHFVKMVHNGIEYGDMQLLAEAYSMLAGYLELTNDEIATVFEEWNRGDLESYLVEITSDIFRKKDSETGKYVIDLILDSAGQKGTGKWTVINGLEIGSPVTLISESVFSRTISSQKEHRVHASKILLGPEKKKSGRPKKIHGKSTRCHLRFKNNIVHARFCFIERRCQTVQMEFKLRRNSADVARRLHNQVEISRKNKGSLR